MIGHARALAITKQHASKVLPRARGKWHRAAVTEGESTTPARPQQTDPPERTAAPITNGGDPPPPLTPHHRHPGLDPGSRFFCCRGVKRDPGSSPG
ncbi:hypothetical protein DC429_05640 [Arthrobacter sp. TPD3018]|nr:hypothetical protein DC425_05630 [Sphingomonas sp. TPD3009]PVE61373.1 hypothetical protein DC429_05640 [Arthrobacter sp. TPD3018]PVE85709.1 hypothetical protein DC431_07545 [Sphingomonas melonis]